MKKAYTCTVVALAMGLMTASPMVANIEGPVIRAEFTDKQDNPLIGDSQKQLEETINTQTRIADLLEKASQDFSDCESRMGKKEIDRANYGECVWNAAQTARNAYQEANKNLKQLDLQLQNYLARRDQGVSENAKVLHKEQEIEKQEKQQLDRLRGQAQELVKSIQAMDPNSKMSNEQEHLINQLAIKVRHAQQMAAMQKYTVAMVERDLAAQKNYGLAFGQTRDNVQLAMEVMTNGEEESERFMDIIRRHGASRAILEEDNDIMVAFSDAGPQFETAMEKGQSYGRALSSLGESSPQAPLAKVQTAGEALALLQSIIETEGGVAHD